MKNQFAELQTAVAIIRDVIPSDLLARLQLEKLHNEEEETAPAERNKEPINLHKAAQES